MTGTGTRPGDEDRYRVGGKVASGDVTSKPEHSLLTDEAWLRFAGARDDEADERDAAADQRDAVADARDHHARARDEALSDKPDLWGSRRFAAQDRQDSADNREAAADDRREAHVDRQAARWDRTVAEQIKALVLFAIDDADELPEAVLVIGRAQVMLVDTFGGTAAAALIEIADRADRDQTGLDEAARRILADGAPSAIDGIRVPGL
jgi:hypothetical protein